MSGCTQLCNQGRDCTCVQPVEHCAAKVAPVKASRRSCAELGVCNCAEVDAHDSITKVQHAGSAHAEVGNIWFAEPEPIEPLTRGEMLAVWGTVLVLSLVGWLLLAMGAGYVWQRWLA